MTHRRDAAPPGEKQEEGLVARYRYLAVPFGIGLVLVAVAVAWILYIQRGAHIELRGSILKVRTAPLDENSSILIVDFRFANPADYAFIVRNVYVSIEDARGTAIEGAPVSEVDAKRLFQYYPLLGQKFNPSLLSRDRIPPHQTEDRMIAVRFEIPDPRLEARRKLTVRIEDVDGPVSELVQEK